MVLIISEAMGLSTIIQVPYVYSPALSLLLSSFFTLKLTFLGSNMTGEARI